MFGLGTLAKKLEVVLKEGSALRPGPLVTTPAIDELVIKLAQAPDPRAMRKVAIELSKPGFTARAARHPAFEAALRRLLNWVERAPDPVDRLHSLTVLARLRKQQNRPLPAAFEAALAEPMDPFTAEPGLVEDPREREYLAQGLRLVRFEGQQTYLAGFITSEGQSRTDARDTATSVLLERSPNLDAAFHLLGDALAKQAHDTQDPATSRMRRLMRVIESLQAALRYLDPSVGETTGDAYAQLLRTGLSKAADREVAIDVTNAALALLLAWVRPNFSVALTPETFRALNELRGLFLPARWPEETRDSRQSVGKLVREAIALLAQAGVTDDRLRQTLVLAVEEPVAESMLRALAREKAGLSNTVRHWLETGSAIHAEQESAAISESVLETIDSDLAEAFRESSAAALSIQSVGEDVQEAVALSNPALADALQALVASLGRLIRRIELVGAKRGFELQGEVGTAVEYAPADHAADEPIAGTRIVRLVSPMVVRRSAGGAPQLILKAKVRDA